MVLPRSTFQVAHHSGAPLPLQQQQQQQQSSSLPSCNQTASNDVKAPKRRVMPPTVEQRQSSSLLSFNQNNNKSNITPQSALELLKRHRQQDASRLSLLLLPPTTTTKRTCIPFSLTTGITQVYGEAGSGKTQIGLSVCVSSVVSSPTHMALHVSLGEGTSPQRIAQRLHQMATSRNSPNQNIDSLLKRIHTRSLWNEDNVVTFVKTELPQLLASQQDHIQVVVLDSIGGMFRITQQGYQQRSSMLFDIASHLKQTSDAYQIPIVVINQVSTKLSTNTLVPALGVSWATCVNTSFRVQRMETRTKKDTEEALRFERNITLVQSSSWPETTIPFSIQASGVVAMPNI